MPFKKKEALEDAKVNTTFPALSGYGFQDFFNFKRFYHF